MFIIAVLLVAALLFLFLARPSGVLYLRKLTLPFLCILFVLCLILFSGGAVKAAQNGLALWAGVVVPSLFPFFVASEIINSTGFVRTSGILLEPVMRPVFNVPGCASFALLLGVTSGYPVGAKITTDLRSSGLLSKNEAERLLAFTNNSGPLFIVGAVGTGMYGSSVIGIFLLACHILACLTVGVLFRFYKRPGRSRIKEAHKKDLIKTFKTSLVSQHIQAGGFGSILGNAVRNSVSTILAIGGFIVLFAVIIQLLSETGLIGFLAGALSQMLSPLGLDRGVLTGVLSGVFEITTGSGIISRLAAVPLVVKLPAVSLIIGWAGLSVHFQVMSIISGTDMRITPYILGKALQGLIAAIYTAAGIKLLRLEALSALPVLGATEPGMSGFLQLFLKALLMMLVSLVSLIVISKFANKAWLKAKIKRSSI